MQSKCAFPFDKYQLGSILRGEHALHGKRDINPLLEEEAAEEY
jgi:hypothetical protein